MTGQRLVAYVFRLWNGEILLVTSGDWRERDYYDSFRVHIGPEGVAMGQLEVLGVDRYRDGGTTVISTPGAVLFSPSPFKLEQGRQHGPTWDGRPLEEIDPDGYEVDEPEGGAAVVRRRATAVAC